MVFSFVITVFDIVVFNTVLTTFILAIIILIVTSAFIIINIAFFVICNHSVNLRINFEIKIMCYGDNLITISK